LGARSGFRDLSRIDDFLTAHQLWKGVELRVRGGQHKRMLQDKSRDPHIVRRDAGSLLAELPVDVRVMMRCLVVGIENPNSGILKESPQHSFVTRSLTAHGKSAPQFSHNNKWQPDFLG
jgi:hypothetical protein